MDTGTAATPKTLCNTQISGTTKNVPDVEFYGEGDAFKCLSKAWSKAEGWMKSTKAMNVPGGVVVQVTTQQGNNIAEAVCFVPDCEVRAFRGNYRLEAMRLPERRR